MSTINVIPWDGLRIKLPGVYSGMPLDTYHKGDICDGPSVSSSSLRRLWGGSPKHFWDDSPLNPLRAEQEDDKEDFLLGRAAHHLICGEAGFAARYIVHPEEIWDPKEGKTGKMMPWHGGRTVCKDWIKTQKAAGKDILKPAHVSIIRGMAVELSKHPFARGAMTGLIEHSLFWKDPETGLWLKARPDVIPTSSGDFVDLKTTRSTQYTLLQKTLDDYCYWMQGALVLECARALGLPASSFSLMFVEKKRPFDTYFLPIIDEDLALGVEANRRMLRRLADCLAKRSWPGHEADSTSADTLQLSERARDRIKDRLALMAMEKAA